MANDNISRQLIPDAGWSCGVCGRTINKEEKCLDHPDYEAPSLHEPTRVMTAAEELERLQLRQENTSERLRAKVLAHNAQQNGSSNGTVKGIT